MAEIPLPNCNTLTDKTVRYMCERIKFLEEKESFIISCVGMAFIVVAFVAFYLSYEAKVKGAPPYKYGSIIIVGLLPVFLFFPDSLWSLFWVVLFCILGIVASAVELSDKLRKAHVNFIFYNNLSPAGGEKLRFLSISHVSDLFLYFVNCFLSFFVLWNLLTKNIKGWRLIVLFKMVVLAFGSIKAMVAIVDEERRFGLLTDGDEKVLPLDKAEDVPSTEFDALFRLCIVPVEGCPEILNDGSGADRSSSSADRSSSKNSEWMIDFEGCEVLSVEGAEKFPAIEGKWELGATRGLVNLGNTCYMNSAIQCVAHTSQIATLFLLGDPPYKLGELGVAFGELIRDLWAPQVRGPELPVSPHAFRDKFLRVEPQFEGYAQHDSQEFLGFLLTRLHEDLQHIDEEYGLNYIAERNNNIVDLCQGEFRSTLRCLICNKSSRKLDTFMFFALPIEFPSVPTSTPSLYGCLEAFQSEEFLVLEEWDCPQCKGKRQSSKRLELWTLPEILVIHLKRFSYTNDKLETFVSFPIHDLDLSNHVAKKSDPEKQLYELYAVINHRGTQRNGHYTSFVKLRDVNRWYEFDDSIVSPVEEEKIQSEYAYVLFYKKVKADVSNGAEPCPDVVLSEDKQLATQGMNIHGDERRLGAELLLLCQVQAETFRMSLLDFEDERRLAAELSYLSQLLAATFY